VFNYILFAGCEAQAVGLTLAKSAESGFFSFDRSVRESCVLFASKVNCRTDSIKYAAPEINQMSSANLIRLGGLAAIVAGILRGVNSFVPSSPPSVAIAILYLLTDIFILFGIIGIYGFQHQESRLWGGFGFLLAIIGIAIIRTGAISGVSLYPIGASTFTAGLSLFAIGSWIAQKLPRWVSVFWVLSTIVGFIGYFIPSLSLLFVISGVIFGIGFAGAGIKVWSATSK
jgi:hypothetical protein